MSVVGIDFGNANNVVALARRKGIDVVLNTESKRETPSMVNFGEKQVRASPAPSHPLPPFPASRPEWRTCGPLVGAPTEGEPTPRKGGGVPNVPRFRQPSFSDGAPCGGGR